MQIYVPGQRWISETEPELGLGLILEVNQRTIQVFYHAANEMRNYAIGNAPLKRVQFSEGDEIKSRDGVELTIASVVETNGTLMYVGSDGTQLQETELCDTSSFDQPETRLLNGHIDTNEQFELRSDALTARYSYGILPVRGLLGGRVDLLPHQLYIAQEVSNRHLPRVLLADEVGLGKTIEACLILHRLMACGIVKRVLILLPNALVHQWFVELLRRFNLTFSIFDEERCLSIEANDPEANPFLDDQLVISSIEFLTGDPKRSAQALACNWDLLIVDEAHHLHWSPTETSPEYDLVEKLSKHISRLLLLTASPEQMGLESHFARLRLLDQKRYPSFEQYLKEQENYTEVAAEIAEQIDDMDEEELSEALDRHGPGRVIFRNTRKCMTGFPVRHARPTEVPEGDDVTKDPRVTWLIQFLRMNSQKKVLVIARTPADVIDLVETIRTDSGIDTAHFHEGMPLIQCDRQAAWFAEEDGARVMVVSEMGGEGRNFQMASHLVLIDLPRDPELLEQRIGRLDRIGQRGDIYIHVPYVKGSKDETVVNWLHEGLNAFAEPVVGGHKLLERFGDQIDKGSKSLIAETKVFYKKQREQIAAGRDQLLELSSFRPDIGNDIVERIRTCEQSDVLKTYLLRLFEQYGVHAEPLDDVSYHIRPDQLFDEWFPIRAEGIRITFDRDEALVRPDTTLMTWDHPMVTGANELIMGSERGSCAICVDPDQKAPLILQAIYVLETIAPPELNTDRFMPPTPIHVAVDHLGEACSTLIKSKLKDGEPWRLLEHDMIRQTLIPSMVSASRDLAEESAKLTIESARHTMRETLGTDYKRLEYLKEVNDNVRGDELKHARKAMMKLDKKLTEARIRLDAIRIITPPPAD